MADFARLDGRPLGERNVWPLEEEYLRFLRWSVWKLLDHPGAAGQGLIALVTNSAFLSRPVMRGVRRFLLDRFDEIGVLDLHGNRRNVFHGRRDENVFRPVKVGISITLFIRYPDRTNDPARVFYRETREVPARAYVSSFNFRGADQQKPVGTLSGGERNRVHLARLLQAGGNVLLLDEPTNDLDVDTLRALEAGFESFPGCVVVISHDRWFLDRIATHILAFEGDSRVRLFEGNVSDYEAFRHRELGTAADQPHRIRFKRLAG